MKNYKKHIHRMLILALWAIYGMPILAANTNLHNVRVGYYSTPGYHNLASDGERSGYGYDFLQLVRRFSQVEFSYTGFDKTWAESLQMLQDGQIDLLTGALRTPEREKLFDYSYPIGSTCLNLYVRNNDSRYRPQDYTSYEGIRIGTVTSEILDERVQQMAARHHFGCTIVAFSNDSSMCRALQNKEIDAMCIIGTHLTVGYRVLESFDDENIYAIVKKGNHALLQLMNDAILQMDQSIAMWPLQLFQANYLRVDAKHLLFSDREKAFIRQHSTAETAIKVATDNNWAPYSWYADGQYHGIVVDMVDYLMKRAGLKYEFIDDDISNESALKSHPEADIYTCFASTKQYAEEQHLVVSPSFLLPSIAIVSMKRYDQLETMGLADNTPMLNQTVRKKLQYKYTTYHNTDEMIEAVKKGLVDGAMLYDYVAQSYVNSESSKRMQINFIPGMTLPIHMVTRMEDKRELISIMSKCIDQMTRNERNNITTRYLSTPEGEKGIWEYMKQHPWMPLLVLLVSISGFLFEKYQRMKIVQRKDALARKLAEDANNAKTSFLFNMSHDIRTPMNAIIGFRDLLEKNQEDPERRADYLHKIQDASMVLLSIINNVLEMARIEKGTMKLEETAWSAEQFSDIIYSIFNDMMEKKGLQFTRQLNVKHPYIYCDTIKMREVFINILSNACKYTPQGHVHMQIDELPCDRQGWVYYRTTVSDTGMGMSEEFLPHLFEEFTRENNTTETKIEGTGLGMPIVKRLVTLMDGTIDVKSRQGEGTTFTVTIPHRIAERTSLTDHAESDTDQQTFAGKRILLAEDNDLNAEIAIELLTEEGFVIERAEDGIVCCNMLADAPAHHYDLILMDIQMPRMNGYEATRQIRKMNDPAKAGIPIYAMTANAFEEDRKNAMDAGMDGHMSKPLNLPVLLDVLRKALR